MREIELRMYGQADPPGELRADAAARVGEALQDVILRLTREAANAAGLGRPPRVLEQLGEVRLAGVTQGSTRLIFRLGDPSALDVDPLSGATDRMFTELVTGIAQNRRPAFVTETIAEATARFVASLQKASPQTDVTLSGRTVARLETGRVDRRCGNSRRGPCRRRLSSVSWRPSTCIAIISGCETTLVIASNSTTSPIATKQHLSAVNVLSRRDSTGEPQGRAVRG